MFGWGIYLAGFNVFPYGVAPEGSGDVYVGGGGGSPLMITPGALHTTPPIQPNTFLIKLDEGLLPAGMAVTASSISPLTQTACILGWSQPIVGNTVTQTAPIGYPVPLYYQWQSAPSPGGPWTNILGQVFQNLQPQPTDVTTYFRRLIMAYSGCTLVPVDSSVVAVVNISGNSAPTANAGGGSYLICPGLSVTLGGAPAATGGTVPYTYAWYAGAVAPPPFSTAANPSSGPSTQALPTRCV